MRMITILGAMLSLNFLTVLAQQPTAGAVEQRVSLGDAAVALDSQGAAALEGTLRSTALNGALDSPVTNIRLVIKNVSALPFIYVSGLVTFYDSAGVRCGEGLFKADALAVNESAETDTPGIRIRCVPATWRMVSTNLLTRTAPTTFASPQATRALPNLVISIDGEEHPIQLDKPMVLSVGDKQHKVIVRPAP